MSLQTGKELRKIALLIVIAGMIMGLASPSACDEFYNNLLKLNGQSNEICYVNIGVAQDCIAARENSDHNQYRPVVRKSGNARIALFRLSNGGAVSSANAVLINYLSLMLLVSVICAAAFSYYHIIYIHLKDGRK